MRSRAEVKARARAVVKQNYWPTVGSYALLIIISIASSYLPFAVFLVTNIVMVGLAGYFLYRFRSQPANVVPAVLPLWQGARRHAVENAVLVLWTLLFIVPGIVKIYSYFCLEYILADSPNVGATRALRLSKRMMNGNKSKVFIMHLSFIGWALLGVTALLILFMPKAIISSQPFSINYSMNTHMLMFTGMEGWMSVPGYVIFYAYLCLFLVSYMSATSAGFYEEIKHDAIMRGEEVVCFEHPAHAPNFEDPDIFNEFCLTKLRGCRDELR